MNPDFDERSGELSVNDSVEQAVKASDSYIKDLLYLLTKIPFAYDVAYHLLEKC